MRHHRKDAAQTGCPGRQTDRNGQHVVDDQARRSQQAHRPAEVLFGHRVGSAAVRVDRDHLPVRDHQHQQQHRDCYRDRQGQPHCGRTRGDQNQHDRFGTISDAGQCVQRQCGKTADGRQPMRIAALVSPHPTISNLIGRSFPLNGYHSAD